MTEPAALKSESFFDKGVIDPAIPYENRRTLLVEGARAYLDHHNAIIRARHNAGESGRLIVGSLTSLVDTLIRNLYRSASIDLAPSGRCALIALGGYGRGELNPHSDIDLMFFHDGRQKGFAERLSERILYLLWDIGLEVGNSIRTAKDCLEMADADITARTALLDSRFLVGDESLYQEYSRSVHEVVLGKESQKFIRAKLDENAKRLRKYGSTVYMLEPNIKEGEGGLRDLHTALWIAMVKFKARSLRELIIKGVFSESQGRDFEEALDYLWRIRNELHYLSGRKNDQIHFIQQEKIAAFLGYRDAKTGLAVEQFMQHYYAHATHVEHLASSFITRTIQQDESSFGILGYLTRRSVENGFYILRAELRVARQDLFETDPSLMMRAFLLSERHSVRLSVSLKGLIRENLHRINDRVRRSKAMIEGFFEILRGARVAETLREMHHLKFLNHFIPEFGRIYCKVQHDAYHVYTVDVHSIFAVEEIAKLWSGEYRETKPLLTQVANDIEKRELLLLAVLFHDIGKGEGKDHCKKGGDMIPTIARRLGLKREDAERLEFLVRNHLQMAHISQRRDLHDDKLIVQFAKTMGMSENLKMLYLLTFSDIRAVGPDVWSEWKGLLLQELYEKTYDVLERGDFRLEKRSEKVRNRKRKVLDLLAGEYDPKAVRDLLKSMSTRYILSHRSGDIADHVALILGRKERPLAMKVEHEPQGEYSQLTITTIDIPGLFSKITGVMAANGINILGAQVSTTSSGIALDVLHVRSAADVPLDNPEKWRRVEDDLVAVLEGRARVEDLVKKRQRPAFMVERPRPRFPNKVEITNEVSDEYTVLDIYAHDRVGLLYQITRTLKELGLYIGVSKISTKVDQVADTLYVQDIFGQKITSDEKIEEIRTRLLATLDEELE